MNPFPGPCSRMWPSWDWMQNSSAHSNPREVMLQDPPVAVLGGGGWGPSLVERGLGLPRWRRGGLKLRGCLTVGFPFPGG